MTDRLDSLRREHGWDSPLTDAELESCVPSDGMGVHRPKVSPFRLVLEILRLREESRHDRERITTLEAAWNNADDERLEISLANDALATEVARLHALIAAGHTHEWIPSSVLRREVRVRLIDGSTPSSAYIEDRMMQAVWGYCECGAHSRLGEWPAEEPPR